VVAGAEKLSPPLVVLFSGPPATGKSTLADAIGRELGAPVISFDWSLAALSPFPELYDVLEGMERDRYQDVGYALMSHAVEKQLRNRQPVILDCVARARAMDRWLELAAAHDVPLRIIECVCSDADLHRSRVEGRTRAIPGWYELEWSHVEVSRTRYEPLPHEKLSVDAVQPLADNLARVRRYLGLGNDPANQGEAR
jgi:predicted kinase